MSTNLTELKDDLGVIWGAAGIAKALGLKDTKGRRKIFHMLERGQLKGATKLGGRWVITREALVENFKPTLEKEEGR